MFKNKALVIVTILVLALSVVAMSCAPAATPATTKPPATTTPPATTATPPATTTTPPSTPPSPPGGPSTTTPPAATTTQPATGEKKTSFASQKYTNDANGFTLSYPASWKEATKPYGTAVFFATDGASPLPDLLLVDVRPGTSVKEAAIATLSDFVSSKGVSASPSAGAEKTITLADGKTTATELVITASVMFMDKKAYALGVVKGGNVITLLAGIDPSRLDLYKEMVETLVLK